MRMRNTAGSRALALAVLAIMALVATGAGAQTAAAGIRPGEVLQMVIPGRPDLDRALVVESDGTVDIPQVGEVRLTGLTLGEAGVLLKQRLRLIAPTLDSVELTRTEAATFRVYVIGQVGHPGVHEFTTHPTVWDVMRAAGGPLRAADCAKRASALDGAPARFPWTCPACSRARLPDRDPPGRGHAGDPDVAGRRVGRAFEPGVKVFGGVAVPSVVPVDGPTRLMDVLMLVGAPVVDANTKKIWWVHSGSGSDEAQQVNLRLFLEKGDLAGNPLIHPGDTVQVMMSRPGKLQTSLAFLLGTAATVAAVFVALNQGNRLRPGPGPGRAQAAQRTALGRPPRFSGSSRRRRDGPEHEADRHGQPEREDADDQGRRAPGPLGTARAPAATRRWSPRCRIACRAGS
ncbi:MAG: polysaccharide biosynthesis/export family protein [bacterium]|nr:polysaccharide biosynthesis/export family protein [bacterium]